MFLKHSATDAANQNICNMLKGVCVNEFFVDYFITVTDEIGLLNRKVYNMH